MTVETKETKEYSTPENQPESSEQLDQQTLEQLFAELKRLAIQANASEMTDRLGQSEQAFKAGKLRVLVLGQFNHGKSLALNALLGKLNLLPTGATPTTAIITEINYGPEAEATLLDSLGRRKTVSLEEYQTITTQPEGGKYKRAEVTAPVAVLKEITFVDTPGLSDPDKYDLEAVGPEINRADVIVFVLSAVQPLTGEEQIFIQEKLTKKSQKRLLFLVNQIDRLNEEEQLAQVMERVNSLLNTLLPGAVALPFSAFEAAKGLRTRDEIPAARKTKGTGKEAVREITKEKEVRPEEALLAQANYAAVKAALTTDLVAEKERIQEATLMAGLEEAADELEEIFQERQVAGQAELLGLEEARTRLDGERGRLEAVRVRIQERGMAELERMATGFMSDVSAYTRRLSNALPEQIEKAQQATPNDVSRNLPFYLEYVLKNYMEARSEQFKEELQAYMQSVGEEIEREFEQAVQTLDPNKAYFLSTLPRLRSKDTVYTWIARGVTAVGAITIFLFCSIIFGLLWLVAGEVVRQAGAMRNQEQARLVEAGRKALNQALETVQKSLEEQFGDVKRSLGTEVAQIFAGNFAALQNRLDELERQAKLSTDERTHEAVTTRLALADLVTLKTRLANLKAQMLGPEIDLGSD